MTRKRVRESLIRAVTEPCFYCAGTGLLKSKATVVQEIYRTLVREADSLVEGAIRVTVHPRVAEFIASREQELVGELRERIQRDLIVESRDDFHLEHFEFSAVNAQGDPHGRMVRERDDSRAP